MCTFHLGLTNGSLGRRRLDSGKSDPRRHLGRKFGVEESTPNFTTISAACRYCRAKTLKIVPPRVTELNIAACASCNAGGCKKWDTEN